MTESRGQRNLATAKIFSPIVQITNKSYCVKLFYLAFGKALFRRELGLKNINRDEEKVFSKLSVYSVNNEDWLQVTLDLSLPESWKWGKMQLFLGVTRGYSFASEVAFDDISLQPGKCPPVEKTENQATKPTPRTYVIPEPLAVREGQKTESWREFNPFFNLETARCVISSWNGKIMVKTEESYNTQLFLCCGNKLLRRSVGDKCCSGAAYFSHKQVCCAGEIFLKREGYSCCSEQFVRDGRVCCGGVELSRDHGCCRGKTFPRESAFCVQNEIVQKDAIDENSLCGTEDFKIVMSSGEACCNSNIYKTRLYGCCSASFVYDLRYEECNDWGKPRRQTYYKHIEPQQAAGELFFSFSG